jgi:parvulin-like peptidyl-prolyl isomerase
MRKSIFLSILIFLLIGGCQDSNQSAESGHIAIMQKITASKVAGESVLVVSGEVITSSDIIESPVELNGRYISPKEHLKSLAKTSTPQEFKKLAQPLIDEILMSKISEALLYQQAKRQFEKNIDEALEKAAEKEVRKFFMEFGGDEAKAGEKLKQMGMDRQKFKENRKRFILTQWYISSKLIDNKPITHTELMNCYKQMKEQYFFTPEKLEFWLIDIQPESLKLTEPNQTSASLAEIDKLEQARTLANQLIERIQTGEDFSELAKQYSNGHMREFGGLWKPVQPESLAEPYDSLAAEAEKIEPGQIAGPIETQGHIFIMKLEDKHSKSYEPFEKVQIELEQKIISDRRKKALEELDAELAQQIDMNEKDEFIYFCLDKIYQMSNQ